MADAAVLPADANLVLERARQGKGYWRRVWERLLDDKVTLAVMAVLLLLLVMVVLRRGSPCMTPTRVRCCAA